MNRAGDSVLPLFRSIRRRRLDPFWPEDSTGEISRAEVEVRGVPPVGMTRS
jgi:hypothetical protein